MPPPIISVSASVSESPVLPTELPSTQAPLTKLRSKTPGELYAKTVKVRDANSDLIEAYEACVEYSRPNHRPYIPGHFASPECQTMAREVLRQGITDHPDSNDNHCDEWREKIQDFCWPEDEPIGEYDYVCRGYHRAIRTECDKLATPTPTPSSSATVTSDAELETFMTEMRASDAVKTYDQLQTLQAQTYTLSGPLPSGVLCAPHREVRSAPQLTGAGLSSSNTIAVATSAGIAAVALATGVVAGIVGTYRYFHPKKVEQS